MCLCGVHYDVLRIEQILLTCNHLSLKERENITEKCSLGVYKPKLEMLVEETEKKKKKPRTQ